MANKELLKKDFIDYQNTKYNLNLPYTATLTEIRKAVEKAKNLKEVKL